MAVNPLALNACTLSFWCNSMGCSRRPLGLGRSMSPEAGAIPCHAGKGMRAELSGCCLGGNIHWACGSASCSFLSSLGQRSSTFPCFSCAQGGGRGGELLLGCCLGSKEFGMSWQFVCSSCDVLLGVELSPGRYRQACRGSG